MYLLILSNSHSTSSLITCSHLRSTSLSNEVEVEVKEQYEDEQSPGIREQVSL